jgi:hypothetical protein
MIIEKDKIYHMATWIGTQVEVYVVDVYEGSDGITYVQWYYVDSKPEERHYPSHRLSDFVNRVKDTTE